MNRAREIRSRLKEAEGNQGTSDETSLVSKSEVQRQQRSRQLEATQKLLDSQTGGMNVTGFGSGRQVGQKSFDNEARHQVERPGRDRSSRALEVETDSQRIRNPKTDHPKSLPVKLHANSNQYSESDLVSAIVDTSKRDGNLSKSMQTLSIAAIEDGMHSTVREMTAEVKGRGRGRGRPRPSVSGGESYIGEVIGSRQSAMVTERAVDARSRSPYSTSTMSSASNMFNDKQEGCDDAAIQAYLRYAFKVMRMMRFILYYNISYFVI